MDPYMVITLLAMVLVVSVFGGLIISWLLEDPEEAEPWVKPQWRQEDRNKD